MKLAILILISTIFLSNCKNPPSFSAANRNDPFNENFLLAPPASFNGSLSEASGSIKLDWQHSPSSYFDGYLIYRSRGKDEDFVKIAQLTKHENQFIDQVDWNLINVEYKIYTYFDLLNGEKKVSSESSFSLSLELSDFNALLTDINSSTFDFSYSQSFFSKTNFGLYQKIGNGNFEFLRNFIPDKNFHFSYSYQSLPSEEITFRLFADNNYGDTLEIQTTPLTNKLPPNEFFLTDITGSSVRINCKPNNIPFAKLLLSEVNSLDSTNVQVIPIQSIPDCTSSFLISQLLPNENYTYQLSAFIKSIPTEKGSLVTITKKPPPVPIDTLNISVAGSIRGVISSDGKYASFTSDNPGHYIYNLNDFQKIYSHENFAYEGLNELIEYNGEIYFFKRYPENDWESVALLDIKDNSLRTIISPLYEGGIILDIEYIENTTSIIVASIYRVSSDSSLNSIFIYDFETEEVIDTLVSTFDNSLFTLSNSDKSIVIYNSENQELNRYSVDNNSFLQTISLPDDISGARLRIMKEKSSLINTQNSDYYYFESFLDGLFRIDLEKPYKEILYERSNSLFTRRFEQSEDGSLKCLLLAYTTETRFMGAVEKNYIDCFNESFEHVFTLDINSSLRGFFISPNNSDLIVFSGNKLIRYNIELNTWKIIKTYFQNRL